MKPAPPIVRKGETPASQDKRPKRRGWDTDTSSTNRASQWDVGPDEESTPSAGEAGNDAMSAFLLNAIQHMQMYQPETEEEAQQHMQQMQALLNALQHVHPAYQTAGESGESQAN